MVYAAEELLRKTASDTELEDRKIDANAGQLCVDSKDDNGVGVLVYIAGENEQTVHIKTMGS